MVKSILRIFGILVVIGVLFWIFGYDKVRDIYDRKQLEVVNTGYVDRPGYNSFTALTYKIKEYNDIYDINIEYPIFAGQDALNNKVVDEINKQIVEFKKTSSENQKAREEYGDEAVIHEPGAYSLYISYEIGEANPGRVSMVFVVDAYTGGAHGMRTYLPFNYHLPGMNPIDLNKILSREKDYWKKISDACVTQIGDAMARNMDGTTYDKKWLEEGCAPKAENFSNWWDNDGKIRFLIGPYQVAPYAAGSFSFDFSYVTDLGIGYFEANKATQYCEIKGGKIQTVKIDRGEYNLCQLKWGRQCEEWALYRGDCKIGGLLSKKYISEKERFCAIFGGEVMDGGRSCRSANGNHCSIDDFFNGLCNRGY